MACKYREEFEMKSFDGKTKLLDKDGNPIKCGCSAMVSVLAFQASYCGFKSRQPLHNKEPSSN